MRFQCPFCQGIVAVANTDLGIDCQCGHCGEIVTVPSYRLSTGAVISDFIILEELGRGGMGIVYLAHQMTLDRAAALKILSDAYAGDAEFVVDFIKEARAAAKLNHPHIVQAYAVGEDEGVFFFAMEHIDGETMKTYLKREGVVPIDFALEVIQQIAEALDYAWKEQRLIHRDIKPDNIMLTKNGRAKLADLGLARVAGEIDDADADEVMGTPQYISPEHLTGAEMDVRSDIYSLGATLFHLITGRFAFEGRSATEIARKHLEETLESPKTLNPKISDGVCNIIFKMMAKRAEERYQSAEDLVEDLRLVRKGKDVSKSSSSGKAGKQFSVKKGGGKTLMMKAPTTVTSTGSSKTLSATKTGSQPSASKSSISMNTESLKLQREKKAKTQLIILVVICLLVLFAGVGFILWKTYLKKPDKVAGGGKQGGKTNTTVNTKKVNLPPTTTEYTEAAKEILTFAAKSPKRKSDILVMCDKFFAQYPEPKYACDENSLAQLLEIFVPIDEERRIKKARQELRRKHEIILRKRKEEADKKKAALERKKREEERKQREAEMEKERLEKEKQRLKEYIATLASSKENLIYRAFFFSFKQKFEEAIEVFDSAIKEPRRISSEKMKEPAEEYSEWAKRMQKAFKIASKTWETMAEAGTKLNGNQIEVKRGELGKVIGIKKGQVTVKTYTNKKITVPLDKLPAKQIKKLTEKAGELIDETNATFFFMMCSGHFAIAKEFCPEDWTSDLEKNMINYFKTRLQVISEMDNEKEQRTEKLKLKPYSRLPEFKKAYKLQQQKSQDDEL